MNHMSQLVHIERVSIRGAAPYIGVCETKQGSHEDVWSRDPDTVMRWLCDGWRCRFNQLRSRRMKYDKDHNLIPIGYAVNGYTVKQARECCSWLAAIPDLVLSSTERVENTEWWAANKRRKTLRKKHKNPGGMPRFRKRRADQRFVCWYNGGRNATYTQVNRHHGIVTITGQNPSKHRQPGQGCRFRIRIHVRVSEPIREYTGIGVNWTRRTLTFTNDPLPVEREHTGETVGIDPGCAHNLTLSDGRMFDLPKGKLKAIDREIRRRQRAQARAVKIAGCKTQKEYRRKGASKRFQEHDRIIKQLYRQAHDIITDCQQKWTTRIVQEFDIICVEDTQTDNMTGKPQPKPDPLRPGHWLPNGRTAKRGLNRTLAQAGIGRLISMLDYKTSRTPGTLLIRVPAAYTSQTCNQCGHIAKGNRESQAVFRCENCAHTDNADHNAALNIRDKGLQHLTQGTDWA